MFKAFFNIIINMLATVVQIIVWPINEVIELSLPDVSAKITEVTNVFGTVFDSMNWALGLIPNSIIITLSFIILCEVAKHTVFRSTHTLLKVWNVIQKVKFW